MKQARRLTAAGQRVALVCYSHGLASYFKRVTSRWPRRQQPGYVGEFHSLGMLWGANRGPAGAERTDATIQCAPWGPVALAVGGIGAGDQRVLVGVGVAS
jgi:hypothetical protein